MYVSQKQIFSILSIYNTGYNSNISIEINFREKCITNYLYKVLY